MPLSDNTRKKPLSLNESYDIVRSGFGNYFTVNDIGEKQLWVWGHNAHGQLPDGTRIGRSSPTQIPGSNWREVSVGDYHMLAVKNDGTLWSWGHNNHAQLGQCGYNSNSSPNQLPGTNWCNVSAGGCRSLAMKCDGTLWTWGYNDWGQLGLTGAACGWSGGVGCTRCVYLCPTQVAGTNWKCASMSFYHALGLKCDGTLWSWGHNSAGQLGYCCIVCPYPGTCCSPVVLNPATGCNYPCCSLVTDIQPSFSSPTQIPGTNWTDIAIGYYHSHGLKTDGTLWGWGHNVHGQVGNCCTTNIYCPVQLTGTGWVEVSSRGYGGFARKSDNTLWAWGHGVCGQLGNGGTSDILCPIQISGTWTRIGRNGFSNYQGFATRSDCTLWGWGYNSWGQLGNNSISGTVNSPVQVLGSWYLCGSSAYHQSAWIKCSG